MRHKLTVAVIDDDSDVRQSLEMLCRSMGLAARGYSSVTDFLKNDGALTADCIVSDICMPDMTGLDLLSILKPRDRNPPIILITGHGDVSLAVQAMKLGAYDFIEKPFAPRDLMAALDRALKPDAAGSDTEAHSVAAHALVARLSRREREVLRGIVIGGTNKQIAYDLGLSVRTVEVYRASMMTKMGVHGLSNLVRIGIDAGLHRPQLVCCSEPYAIPDMPDKGALKPRSR